VGGEWDAGSYERVSAPQLEWGRRVVGRVRLAGDEDALDAGCGTGRVTRLLAERLPRGTVLAVDGSTRMVGEARERLADLGERVRVRHADLTTLELDEPVDLIVSTATFHWITDHENLFARLHAALRPGGRLVAQCGGAGNIAGALAAAERVGAREPYAAALAGMPRWWLFAGADETVARLESAGFTDATAWLEETPAVFPDIHAGTEFLTTVVLRHHLERMPEAARRSFVRSVAMECMGPDGRMLLDYVRLNLEARRPG
jgi:trans-aconitate 2-methyltransferase